MAENVLQQTYKGKAGSGAEAKGKSVTLCIQSQQTILEGVWQWELQTEGVYASDVMSFPQDFEGTKGIIHPDDIPHVLQALALLNGKESLPLTFRLITTYGQIKTISGDKITVSEPDATDQEPEHTTLIAALELLALRKKAASLQQLKELLEAAEKLQDTGTWYINKTTGGVYYSNNLYRLHGLPAQSLNAHAHTFDIFIHPDDRPIVADAIENAYKEELPLHITYRIIKPDKEVRQVQLTTFWSFTQNGQRIGYGIMQDMTGQKKEALQVASLKGSLQLQEQVLHFMEQQTGAGYWYTNLFTHKTDFSPHYLRIYGIKQQALPGYNSFLNLVHPEDRARVAAAIEKIYLEHILPEMEFRIIRPDGKVRWLRQWGKLVIGSGADMLMLGVVQDITVHKAIVGRLESLDGELELNNAVYRMAEETALISSVVWHLPEEHMTWSDSLYALMGYRRDSVASLQRLFIKSIHPGDRQAVADTITRALSRQEQESIVFRLVTKTGVRTIRMTFRYITLAHKEAVIGLLQDVTQQKGTEEQLAGQLRLDDLIYNAVPDMLLLTNLNHTVVQWNEEAARKTGISRKEALHRNLFDLFPQLKEDSYFAHLQKALTGEKASVTQARNAYISTVHDYYLLPYTDENGTVTGLLHLIHDATKEQELHQRLSDRLNFIENLVEASVDRIIVLDRHMNYLYWNHKAEGYYSINRQRVLGRNILEIFPSFRNDPSYQEFRKVLKGQTVHIPATVAEDSTEYFETYLIPIKNEKEQITGILWITHDLSKEYRLQEEKRQNQELLQATMDSSLDMIQVFKAVRNEDGAIVDFEYVLLNHEAEKWMPDAIGKRLLQEQPGVVKEGIFDAFKQVVETGIPQQYEKHYVHEQFDGWFHQSVVKLNDGVATTTTNITKRKDAEQELVIAKANLQAVLDSSFYVVQAFKAVREESGKIVDFVWIMNNRHGIKQNGHVIGKSLLQQNPGVIPSGLFSQFVAVTETGVPVDQEVLYNYEQFSGWFRQTLVKLDDGFVMNTEDITERKKAERELKESKELVQTVFDISLNPIAYHKALRDDSGKIIDFEFQLQNREARKYAAEDLRGKKYSEAYPGIKDTAVFKLYCDVVETGKELNAEVQLNLRGNDRWFHLMGVKLDDGLVATALDISQRKKTEAEILRLKDEIAQKVTDKYYSLFNSIDEGLSILELIYDDSDKPVDMRWIEVNPAFERITGLKNVAGRLCSELVPTEQYWLDAYDSVVKTGEPLRYENYHAGVKQWYRTYTSRIGGPGSRIVANVFEDITERKQQEKRQALLLQLNDAIRSLSDPAQIIVTVSEIVGRHYKVGRCGYAEVPPPYEHLVVERDWTNGVMQSLKGSYPLTSFGDEMIKQYRTGKTIVVEDALEDPRNEGKKPDLKPQETFAQVFRFN